MVAVGGCNVVLDCIMVVVVMVVVAYLVMVMVMVNGIYLV
jgi:hypothetical protein